ncbi:TauD/TfdA dioxygenase family protein [Streptomyces sp. CG1]|uniref:TauD/TfdA dioxygenase family protein n=1 Tax=Streptomyces sp. CG1 TaxID=1287523 RepID=UPI0034E1FAE2
MEVRSLTTFIGAEITAVTFEELRQPEICGPIHETLHQRELIVLRDMAITPEQQIELARMIGRPVPLGGQYQHPRFPEIAVFSNAVRNGKPLGVARVGNFWHQDSSFAKNPAAYSMLHGVDVPHTSGHTLYASACDVYDRLTDDWKARIDGRTALHTYTKRIRITQDHIGLSVAELRARVEAEYPLTEHPLVKRDPFTGRRYVYGAPECLDRVSGFDANDNDAFFRRLNSLLEDREHIYVHRWRPRDLALWKTATTYHASTAVEPGQVRTVHRISIAAPDS